MAETIDLTPEGVKKDPKRVNQAAKDLETTAQTLNCLSWQFIQDYLDELKELATAKANKGEPSMMEDLAAIREAQEKHNSASQALMKAISRR